MGLEKLTCVFCARPSTRAGEHVRPKWLMEMFPDAEGPYTTYKNGQPVVNRDGAPRSQSSIGSVNLPCCFDHNGQLNQRFEVPAKAHVRGMFAEPPVSVPAGIPATDVAIWLLKTWLLLAHPAVVHSDPSWEETPWTAAPDVWSWMVNDQPPPAGLSLWIERQGHGPKIAESERMHVPLPTIEVAGEATEFVSHRAGLKDLDLSLLYHPGWAIDHPLERDGRAIRLWPYAGAALDLTGLPEVPNGTMNWVEGPVLRWNTFPGDRLPALDERFDLIGLVQSPGIGPLSGGW